MFKIATVEFKDHPILGNLKLDFCDKIGIPVDTVIIAGENGCGKSVILNELYESLRNYHGQPYVSRSNRNLVVKLFDVDNNDQILCCFHSRPREDYNGYICEQSIRLNNIQNISFQQKFTLSGIFSDIEINFNSGFVNSTTALVLDSEKNSQRSNNDLAKQIQQLLVDVQAMDDAELSLEYRRRQENNTDTNDINVGRRMERFTKAFDKMFDHIKYKGVVNENNNKKIMFEKNGVEIPISSLSSGEKQIVYRGGFLLKDVNALRGAIVFIDEPEISMHPAWQKKIMDYYKGIFMDENGQQTSQIFAVTHSPFIIHNQNRKNDKVIVLKRDEQGNIVVLDKPVYEKCSSCEAVEDAFNIGDFDIEKSYVYVEGRTDEKYFKKALEVYNFENLPFEFKWIGHFDQNGNEEASGKDYIDKVFQFMKGQKVNKPQIFLKDCDTNAACESCGKVCRMSIQKRDNVKGITVGIENAMMLDNIDVDMNNFRTTKEKTDSYGCTNVISDFRKMSFCEYICNLENETLKEVLANLKVEIELLRQKYSDLERI